MCVLGGLCERFFKVFLSFLFSSNPDMYPDALRERYAFFSFFIVIISRKRKKNDEHTFVEECKSFSTPVITKQ